MTVAVFAILMALGGAYAVRKYLDVPVQKAAPVAAAPGNPVIPVAGQDLLPGKAVAMGDILMVSMTATQIKARNIPGDAMGNPKQIIGRVLRNPIKKGQAFTLPDLFPEGMGPSISQSIKPGMRAITVEVGDLGAVAGFAGPGSYVDVIFRSAARGRTPELTATLVEKAEVLAFGATVTPGAKTSTNPKQGTLVTLSVTPEQAQVLRVVQGRGELALSLRNPDDPSVVSGGALDRVYLDKVMGIMSSPGSRNIEIYRGGGLHRVTFEDNQVTGELFGGVTFPGAPSPVRPGGTRTTSNTTAPATGATTAGDVNGASGSSNLD